MRIVTDPALLRAEARERRARGERIGLVPTMGYLHAGHTSLIALARPRCDWLVTSIYVNPLQFGPNEDLSRYPRDPDGDAQKCAAAGTDLLFMPTDLYAPNHATRVRVDGLSAGQCGIARPTHFEGVATVVARLFGLVQPHLAIFGEKDYQQLRVIQQMVDDLALDVVVEGGPLVRDGDGVALSSRNAYLSTADRGRARTLHQALYAMRAAVDAGERDADALLALGRARLDVDRLDYLDVVDGDTLAPLPTLPLPSPSGRPPRALLAAVVGRTRLLDNVALG